MKKTLWSLLLILALCLGCAQAEALPPEGEYTVFAVEVEGYLVQSDTMGLASVLRLDAGVHLRYDVDLEYMNAHQSYDVHSKGGV